MKKIQQHRSRRLTIAAQTIRSLATEQLTDAAGARPPVTGSCQLSFCGARCTTSD